MDYGSTVAVEGPFQEVVTRVRAALAEQGFGVLTEIDVQATMKAKLDEDLEPYLILGACNPPLALRALQAERDLGLLLPCNVVVRQAGDQVLVQALAPSVMVKVSDAPGLPEVAAEAGRRLDAALASLAGGSSPS